MNYDSIGILLLGLSPFLGLGWDLVGVNSDSIGILVFGLSPFLGLVWDLVGVGIGWPGVLMGLVWEIIRPIKNKRTPNEIPNSFHKIPKPNPHHHHQNLWRVCLQWLKAFV